MTDVEQWPELSGVVWGLDTALPDATLLLVDAGGQELARARSGADGGFRFRAPADGQCLVLVTAEGYRPTVDLFDPRRAAGQWRIVLERAPEPGEPAGGLSGQVRYGRFGQPVPGVRLHLVDGRGAVCARTVTSPEGRYSFPVMPPGRYSIVVAPAVAPTASSASLSPGTRTELDLTLAEPA